MFTLELKCYIRTKVNVTEIFIVFPLIIGSKKPLFLVVAQGLLLELKHYSS